jgi:hypothetical protein
MVKNLFMSYSSLFFSRHGAGNKPKPPRSKKNAARKAASLLQDADPPFQTREAYLFPDIPYGPAPLVKTGRSQGSEVTKKVPQKAAVGNNRFFRYLEACIARGIEKVEVPKVKVFRDVI